MPDWLKHVMDHPVGDLAIYPPYLVSRLVRQSVTVALSADGGGELPGPGNLASEGIFQLETVERLRSAHLETAR